MQYLFDIGCSREIESAAFCYFKEPVTHPSRNMSVHDFVYMLEGEWSATVGAKTLHAQSGDVMILPANIDHFGAKPCSPGTKTLYFHVYAVAGDAVFEGGEQVGGIVLPTLIRAAKQPGIRHFFERIVQVKGNAPIVTAYTHALLYELGELSAEKSGHTLAQALYQYIAASETLLSNSEIAAHFGVSVRTAEQAFKAAYGMTLHRFAVKCKLEEARRYLLDYPTMKLSSVAAALGFYDEFHFSRTFKAAYGVSPRAFKQER